MSWAFQPLLPAAANAPSGPQTYNVGVTESCTAADTKTGGTAQTAAATEGGVPSSPNVGYVAGSTNLSPSYTQSNVGRFRFDTETFGQSSALLNPRKRNAVGFGAAAKGYMVGGYDGANFLSDIQALTFSTEVTTVLGATLTTASAFCAGVSSSTRGYICDGGDIQPPTGTVEGFRLDTEATVAVSATLNVPRWGGAGVSSSTRGYIAGDDYAGTNAIDGVRFDTEAAITTAATISTTDPGRLNPTSSSTRGYWSGGVYDATDTAAASLGVDAIRYDTEAAVNPAATLAYAHINGTGLSSSIYGYIIGGVEEVSVEKLLFSAETTSSIANVLDIAWQSPCGFQGARTPTYDLASLVTVASGAAVGTAADAPTCASSTDINVAFYAGPAVTDRGYFCGGYDGGSNVGVIRTLVYSSEAASTLSASLNTQRRQSGVAASDFKGYVAGGVSQLTSIEAILFADQTRSVLSATLPTGTGKQGSVESDTAGYFAGGDTGSYSSTVHKLLFSTEATSTPSATLSAGRIAPAGASSSTKGYIAGGEETGSNEVTTNEAITFSTDTIATLGAVLSTARAALAGLPSSTSAYWCGGFTNLSVYDNSISRLQFSNETSYAVTATLVSGRSTMGGAVSASKGYMAGGINGSYLSAILALTFSGETTATLSATLSTALMGASGISYNAGGTDSSTGSQATAYQNFVTVVSSTEAVQHEKMLICGGYWSGYLSVVDVMNNATEVMTTGGMALSQVRGGRPAAMVSPRGEGYLCGGILAADYVDSIEGVSLYSNTTRALSSVLSVVLGSAAGVSSSANGYTMGGITGGSSVVSTINSMVFATEAVSAISATLPIAAYTQVGTWSDTKGYAMGGYNSGIVRIATTHALTFSGETTETLAASLSSVKSNANSFNTAAVGYCVNGTDNSTTLNSVDKLTFSSETMTTGTAMWYYRKNAAGVWSSLAGYTCGGDNGGAGLNSLSKLLFSTGATSSAGATLSAARNLPAGLSYASPLPALDTTNASASGSSPGVMEEAATGADTTNGVATTYAAHAASATAAASHDALALFISAIANAAAAADAVSATAGFAASTTELGSAADAKTLSYLAGATIAEVVTSLADHDGTVYTLLSVGVTEAANGQDIPPAVLATAAAIVASASATDSPNGINAIGGSASESLTASASQVVTFAAVSSSVEAASAVDYVNGGPSYTSAKVESATPGAVQVAQRDTARSAAEAASATMAARAGNATSSAAVGAATATHSQGVLMHAVLHSLEAATAQATAGVHAFFVVDYTGAASAADILSAVSRLPVLVNEQAHAVDFVVIAPWGDLLPGVVRVYVGYRKDLVPAGAKSMIVATGEEAVTAASGAPAEIEATGVKHQIAHVSDGPDSAATTGKESGKVSSGR